MSKQDLLKNGTLIASNGIYKVAVEDMPNLGGGQYTIGTDSGHPAGPNLSILYGGDGGYPGTSYNTIRSFTSHTDYTQDGGSSTDPGYQAINMSPASTTVQSGTNIRTTFVLTTPQYSDNLTIVQNITIHGTTYNDSAIEITTAVTNTGLTPVTVGIRYLWDYELDGDDGPTFQQLNPDGSVLTTEQTFSPVTFVAYDMANNTGSPPMHVKGAAKGLGTISPVPTPPSQLQYTRWGSADSVSFSYTTSGRSTDDDCAVLYYWWNQSGTLIPPGQTVTVTTSLYEVAPPSRGISFLN